MSYKILQGDNRETLKTLADNSIDAIITDPPYGIDFLGKAWDANTGALETYQECLRVLKPGGHILAFSAARTYHHLAITLEQAGFEIRDQIMWIYSSGFPKSQDIGKSIQRKLGVKETKKNKSLRKNLYDNTLSEAQGKERITVSNYNDVDQVVVTDPEAKAWAGWGTALKPAHEPIALARKPLKTSIAQNCQKWGVGALNIDATRVPYEDQKDIDTYLNNKRGPMERSKAEDGEGIGMFEGKVGYKTIKREVSAEQDLPEQGRFPANVIGEIADYQKYFYCPKVSRKERHIGFNNAKGMFEVAREHGYTLEYPEGNYDNPAAGYMVDKNGNKVPDLVLQKLVEQYGGGNNHPTVKPIALMEYLIKLVTPAGGTVLDPFNGSGSTGCAAVGLSYNYIGCELDPAYVDISIKRIEAWTKDDRKVNELFE